MEKESVVRMNYHNITHDDMNNGDGLRVVLWLSGCSHKCKNCQNPQTWNPDSGILFDEDAKNEIFAELSKDYISGITFSGGDPLYENNIKEVLKLTKEIKTKFPQKTIWLYTGYTFEYLLFLYEESKKFLIPNWKENAINRWNIITLCDVLIDGEYIDEQRDVTLKWRGSKNQRVINIPETLKQNEVILYCD